MKLKNIEFNELDYYPVQSMVATVPNTTAKIYINEPRIKQGEQFADIEIKINNFTVLKENVKYENKKQIKQEAEVVFVKFIKQFFEE